MEITMNGDSEEEIEQIHVPFSEIAAALRKVLDEETSTASLKLLEKIAKKNKNFAQLLNCMYILAKNGQVDYELLSNFEELYKRMLKINMNSRDALLTAIVFEIVTIVMLYILSLDDSYMPAAKLQIVMSSTSLGLALHYRFRNYRMPKKLDAIADEALIIMGAFSDFNNSQIKEREASLRELIGQSVEELLEEVGELSHREAASNLGDDLDIIYSEA